VVNTVTGDRESMQDVFAIRRAAAERHVPCFTSIDTARAAIENLTGSPEKYNVKPLDSYLQHL
jgi:carbamoyl-phosphate synthase large subunit